MDVMSDAELDKKTPKVGRQLVDAQLAIAYEAIDNAILLAKEYGVDSFSFDVAYGMGGTYVINPSADAIDHYGIDNEGGWMPSSRSC